jgi:hypothetical protein
MELEHSKRTSVVAAKLLALRTRLPETHVVSGSYVTLYHRVLDELEIGGSETDRFRIPTNWIIPNDIVAGMTSGNVRDPWIAKALFVRRIEEALCHFYIKSGSRGRKLRASEVSSVAV